MQPDVHILSSSDLEHIENKTDLEKSSKDTCILPVVQISHANLITLVVNEINEVAVIHKKDYTDKKYYACIATNTMYESNNAEDAIAEDIGKKLGVDVQSVEYLSSYYHRANNVLHLGYVCKVNKDDFNLLTDLGIAKWMNMYEACKQLKDCSLSIFLLKNYLESE
jgi:NADH pyrophosphatase NudC (nudix superfamily)